MNLDQLKQIAIRVNLQHHHMVGAERLTEQLIKHCEEIGTSLEEIANELGFTGEQHGTNRTSESVQEQNQPDNNSHLNARKDRERSDTVQSVQPVDAEVERLRNLTFVGMMSEQAKKSEAVQLKDAMKLIRCIITCNNKNKTSYQGEIFTVNNAILPMSLGKKMIPFGVPTHVPQIILNAIKEKQYQMFKEVRQPNGMKTKKPYLVPEYNINILDPLTREEHDAIRKKQLAEGFTGE